MRKPASCIYDNKDADQLRGKREAEQRLCFRYTDSTIPSYLNPKFRPLAILCGCTARFVWDLVGNPEDRFSHSEAQMSPNIRKHPICICDKRRKLAAHVIRALVFAAKIVKSLYILYLGMFTSSESITSVREERANLSAVVYL